MLIDGLIIPYGTDYTSKNPAKVLPLSGIAEQARWCEAAGYRGAWCGESNNDAMLPLAIAAEHTERLEIGTGIVTVFPRSPMHVALAAHDLQLYSGGRFNLGLGSQIRPHVEKRLGGVWDRPVERIHEFVQALRAIWACWNDGAKLEFEGTFYRHILMTPVFVPPPSPNGPPKIFLAAVGPSLAETAGRVADGVITHAFASLSYLETVTLRAVQSGLSAAGRDRSSIQISSPVFIATGLTDEERSKAKVMAKAQVAFYASTPAYRKVLDHHGWGDLQNELADRARRGDWAAMGGHVPDDVLDAFVVTGTPEEVAAKLARRQFGIDRLTLTYTAGTARAAVEAVVESVNRQVLPQASL